MKFIHLSDLHLGKRLKEYSLLEDQEYILRKITEIILEEKPDGVLIAGDVYDRTVPSEEAVQLFDRFLMELEQAGAQAFIISGNHDSSARLSFGSTLMERSGVHISPVYDGNVKPITLYDEYGELNVYMLPFIKPATVRGFFEDAEIDTYTDAVGAAVTAMSADYSVRNILMTHQFVTGADRCDSEVTTVGGTDNVDAAVFDGFDYVALGHLHRPQDCECTGNSVRYCGTPLKYSLSEANDEKSVTVIELKGKGSLAVREIPLVPLRDIKQIKGTYNELTLKSFYDGTTYQDDYMYITLTDEEDIPEAMSRLRVIYHNITELKYDNSRTRSNAVIEGAAAVENKTPSELFGELYSQQNGAEMSDEQAEYIKALIEQIWEGEQ